MAHYPLIGKIPMPDNFKYGEVLRRGPPQHEKWDNFRLKHPPMTPAHWAKIFSPFDALEGFMERIAEKESVYEDRVELCGEDLAELDRRLNILRNLTWNSRLARANCVKVSVIYFLPCGDKNHAAFQMGAGSYQTAYGTVLRVGADALHLRTDRSEQKIPFRDIREIEGGIFEREREKEFS